ncbi:MAG: glycosyltransferase [Enterococcus cecorum]|nr:glycosyltransferase [Enterococcus cecorum]CAI3478947.1 hypothetical protein CIRMBP1204_02338 [Enterococcus cecorum]
MKNTISTIIIDDGDNLKRCYDSVNKVLPDSKILILSKNEQNIGIKPNTSIIQVNHFDMAVLMNVVKNNTTGEKVLFVHANDYLEEGDALEKNLALMEKSKAEAMVSDLVELREGLFYYRFIPTGNFQIVNTNNIIPYMRFTNIFRNLYGMIFNRELLLEIFAYEEITTSQELIYFAAHYAKNMILAENQFYCWINDGTYQVEEFEWRENYAYSFAHRVSSKLQKHGYRDTIPDEINIALCIDDNLVKFLDTLIYSIEKNHQKTVNVYIVSRGLKNENLQYINQLNQYLEHVQVFYKQVPKELYQMQQAISLEKTHLPIDTYLKVLLPEILSDLDKVLYLDTDILVNQDLTDLWVTPLNGYFAAVSLDSRNVDNGRRPYHSLFGEHTKQYFNSGTMLMDLQLMRKYRTAFHITNLAMDTAHLYEQADQDAFNLFLFDAVKMVDLKYNYCVLFQSYIPRKLEELAIIHFANPDKAWRNIEIHEMPRERRESVHLYRQYRNEAKQLFNECPEKISIILDARNSKYRTFEKTIESFLSQDYTNIELLIQVESSMDLALKNYLDSIQSYYPEMIYVMDTSLSRMVEQATGNYIYIMDIDHFLFHDSALAIMLQHFDRTQNILFTPGHKMNHATHMMHINSDSLQMKTVTGESVKSYFEDINGMLFKKEYLLTIIDDDKDAILSKIKQPVQIYNHSLWMRVYN